MFAIFEALQYLRLCINWSNPIIQYSVLISLVKKNGYTFYNPLKKSNAWEFNIYILKVITRKIVRGRGDKMVNNWHVVVEKSENAALHLFHLPFDSQDFWMHKNSIFPLRY